MLNTFLFTLFWFFLKKKNNYDHVTFYSWCNQVLWSSQMVQKNTSRRWDLWSEVGPLIRGDTSNWRWDLWLKAPMLHVGISYSLEKKRLFIVDYIKPSPVYQVKCKLVIWFWHFFINWLTVQLNTQRHLLMITQSLFLVKLYNAQDITDVYVVWNAVQLGVWVIDVKCMWLLICWADWLIASCPHFSWAVIG